MSMLERQQTDKHTGPDGWSCMVSRRTDGRNCYVVALRHALEMLACRRSIRW